MRLWVIAYDIASDSRRYRLAVHLGTRMNRVQESVFEGWLHAPEMREILEGARALIDEAQDQIRAYPLAMRTSGRCTVMGMQEMTAPTPNYWIL